MKQIKQKYKKAIISKHWLRISAVWRFNKKYFKIINIKKRRPNLIIVGCQKCGTTSLFHYLSKHPQIAPSFPFKEPGYFMFEEWAKKYWLSKKIEIKNKEHLLNEYMFKKLTNEKYFMEASTYYTQDINEVRYNIPEKIYKENHNAKIIYLIRNPFQRLISLYYHEKRKNNLVDFQTIFENEWHINTCLYYDRIKPYIDVFGEENIHIMNMEDLQKNGDHELNKVYKFLELDKIDDIELTVHNKTSLSKDSIFNEEIYERLLPLFFEQQNYLKQLNKIEINWNLDKEFWLGKK